MGALWTAARLVGASHSARLGLRSQRGATAVEYAIMVAMIAAVIIVAVFFLGERTSSTFSCTASALSAKTGC